MVWTPHSELPWYQRFFRYLARAGFGLLTGVLTEYGLNKLNAGSSISYDIGFSISNLIMGSSVGENYAKRDREAFIVSAMLYLTVNAFWIKILHKK